MKSKLKYFGLSTLVIASCFFLLKGAGIDLKFNDRAEIASVPESVIVDARDGNQYNYLKIGELYWLKESLRFKAPESECYKGIEQNSTEYGRLYSYSDSRIACPEGWRLPNPKDWKGLKKRMKSSKADKIIVPGKWEDEKFANASNALGLSILPSGRKDEHGASFRGERFGELGISASFWLDDTELHWHVRWGKSQMHKHGDIRVQGRKFAVRCVCEELPKE